MGEKAQPIKKVANLQKTLDSKQFKVGSKSEKVRCEYCKSRVIDVIRHLEKCHRNPENTPKIELDWNYIEQYRAIEEFLIRNPCTEKMKEFNKILAPQGDPFEKFEREMLNYARKLPKAHKDQMIRQKLDRIITEGIEVRLLTREEYFQRLKAKIKSGYKLFLFDPLKATTVGDIEQNEDMLWS